MKKNIFIALCAIIGLSACSDSWLQEDSLTESSSETFWKTSDDAMMALVACYDGLQSEQLYNGGPWNMGPLNFDCMTDNGGHFNWSGWMEGYDIANGTQSPSSWKRNGNSLFYVRSSQVCLSWFFSFRGFVTTSVFD